jgi:SAM-dependent methyltransferase
MSQKWLLRGVVVAALALALWLGWERVRPPERVGDVPYVPTRPEVVDRMLELAEVGPDDFVFDLGSGDGRIVIRAAELYGARARGFEIDPLLVSESRAGAAAAGVAERVEFIEGDLFEAELGEATVVTLYLLPTVNLALRPRLFAQLAPGTPVVSQTFDMAEWRPDVHQVMPLEPPADLYQWVIPAPLGGVWDLRIVAADASSLPSLAIEGVTLRLLQRFQELEGELLFGGRGVPVTGTIRGSRVSIATTRQHPELGRFSFDGVAAGDALEGVVLLGGVEDGIRGMATRRPASLQGVWNVGASGEPFVPQWSMRLSRRGARWTATRWPADTGAPSAAAPPLPGSLPSPPAASTGERNMGDFYVWGSSISFVIGAADGSPQRVIYHGLIEGDRITGVAHDGGALVPWIAERQQQRP